MASREKKHTRRNGIWRVFPFWSFSVSRFGVSRFSQKKNYSEAKMKLISQLFHCVGLGKGSARVSSAKVINLIVLGFDESGKTTMCLQLHNNLDKGTTPTTGLTKFAPLHVQGYNVILHDMGGADGCRKMWKSYFANVHGVVFVVDSTKKSLKTEMESFRETVNHPQVKAAYL